MLVAYCRRRGSRDPEGLAAEALSIAWAKRADLNRRDCRPWLIATVRNLLHEEYRSRQRSQPMDPGTLASIDPRHEVPHEVQSLNADVDRALNSLSAADREALLLVAWEELTPGQAARSLGISPVAFRVRLHRARGRFMEAYEPSRDMAGQPELETETGT